MIRHDDLSRQRRAVALAVRYQRERRGWSQRELGRRSGVSQNAITNIEGGARNATLDTLLLLAAGLGVGAGVFFRRDDV